MLMPNCSLCGNDRDFFREKYKNKNKIHVIPLFSLHSYSNMHYIMYGRLENKILQAATHCHSAFPFEIVEKM